MRSPAQLRTPAGASPRLARHRTAMRRGISRALLLGSLGVVSVAAIVAVVVWRRGGEQSQAGALTHPVVRGVFFHDVVERGEVESSDNVEIRCEVKGRNGAGTSILEVVPEGTHVKAGDVLVRLDASALEDERIVQQIACNNKQALMIQAQNFYEAAVIARQEYLEGTFKQEEQVILSEVFVAEETLRRAQQYAGYSERLAAKGYVTSLQLEGDRFAVEKALKELETARTRLAVLQTYTRPKMLKQLDADIKTSEAQWKSEESSYVLEQRKLSEVEDQIAKCVIRAPQDGQVVHANDRDYRGNEDFIVAPGALVRERQTIIRMPDARRMQVTAEIDESRVSLLAAGMAVSVEIDAFDGQAIRGEVTRVNEYPEPTSRYSSYIKKYLTTIKLIDPPSGIRAGLTAKARIHVTRIDNALQVPVQAVHQQNDQFFCMVRNGQQWQPRVVRVAAANDQFVAVEAGLSEKELVALNPRRLADEMDLANRLPSAPPEVVVGANQPTTDTSLHGASE